MLNPPDRAVANRIRAFVVVAIVAIVSVHTTGQQTGDNRLEPRMPAGFRAFDAAFWEGPWVSAQNGTTPKALPALHNTMGALTNGPLPIRLDDGSTGTVRIESRPCTAADHCEPFDCGCPLPYESYWIDVDDSVGRTVAHLHLWAAYGVFDVVAVDLVDGQGDELMIIRVPAHASPRVGPDLKIWKLAPTKPIDLVDPLAVAGWLGTTKGAVSCAGWRTSLSVNLMGAKPRPIALQGEFAAMTDWQPCDLNRQGSGRVATLKRGQVLHFQGGKYRLR
jgi:hypothetical protein